MSFYFPRGVRLGSGRRLKGSRAQIGLSIPTSVAGENILRLVKAPSVRKTFHM